MKHRFLHLILSLLLLVSAPVGVSSQTAIIDKSDGIKVVTVHSSAQEVTPMLMTESEIVERNIARSQRKSFSSQEIITELFFEKSDFSFLLSKFSSTTLVNSRVLLLPESLQTVFFLQTIV